MAFSKASVALSRSRSVEHSSTHLNDPSIPAQPLRNCRSRISSLEDLLYRPEPEPPPPESDSQEPSSPSTMTEPRARAARHKGQLNFEAELTSLLYAFGDVSSPLPETVRVLDEIVTDFIIEMCHTAARAAAISGRQKVKVEDFMFAMRHHPVMIGRVKELLGMERELKEARKHFDTQEGKIGLERGGRKRKVREGEEAPDGM